MTISHQSMILYIENKQQIHKMERKLKKKIFLEGVAREEAGEEPTDRNNLLITNTHNAATPTEQSGSE